jgi:hypothetical protein
VQPVADHYIGYTAKKADNKDGDLVIELDNGPYAPVTITIKDEGTKQPITGLVLIEATDTRLSFAQTVKGGPQNITDVDIEGHEVEVSDPTREQPVPPEVDLPPDPSAERVTEGPALEEAEDGDQEEAESSGSTGA